MSTSPEIDRDRGAPLSMVSIARLTSVGVPPTPLTPLIGRAAERARVAELIQRDARLVTLTGPGGVGKTRLALQLVTDLAASFPDGVAWVPLGTVNDADHVVPAIAKAFGVQAPAYQDLAHAVTTALHDTQKLLILDNVEHVLESAARFSELLKRCPRLVILATSRSILRLSGEQVVRVPPLKTPDPMTSPAQLGDTEAVQMFIERAQAVSPEFALTETTTPIVATICRRLDGLPLAIELAAARAASLSPTDLLARLERRLPLLTTGTRDAPARQRTMRDAIAWSYDLLSPEEQRHFRRLSVFVGGFTLDAAEMMSDDKDADMLGTVASLVDGSLLSVTGDANDGTRYSMLETIREFSLEQLRANGEEDDARQRHAAWCLATVRPATPIAPTNQEGWLVQLDAEHGNLHAAMQWLDATDRLAELAELVTQLRWYWHLNGRNEEGMRWYERILARYPDQTHPIYIDTLRWAGYMAQVLGRPEASTYLERAMSAAQASHDTQREAAVIEILAIMAMGNGEYDLAEHQFQTALSLYDDTYFAWKRRTIDFHLGVIAYGRGDLANATRQLEAARNTAIAADDRIVPVGCSMFLALIACEQGKIAEAAAHLRPHVTGPQFTAQFTRPMMLRIFAVLAGDARLDDRAAWFLGAASAGGGDTIPLPERAVFERTETVVRERMGEEMFGHACETGRSLTPDQVEDEIERLLDNLSQRPAPQQSDDVIDTRLTQYGLTPRELDVLRGIVDYLTDREIAERLSISRRTVGWHVTGILNKLAVNSRRQAATKALDENLI